MLRGDRMNYNTRIQTFESTLLHSNDTAAVPWIISTFSLLIVVFCASLAAASIGVRRDTEGNAERKSRVKDPLAVVCAGHWATTAFPTTTLHVVTMLSLVVVLLRHFPLLSVLAPPVEAKVQVNTVLHLKTVKYRIKRVRRYAPHRQLTGTIIAQLIDSILTKVLLLLPKRVVY